MKLDVLTREVSEIVVTDEAVAVTLEVSISHGAVKKSITPISVEHEVSISPLFPSETLSTGVDDAIVMAVAGANKRADEAIAALRGLEKL